MALPHARLAPAALAALLVASISSLALAETPPITGEARPELARFDRLMTGFLEDHKVPGASLAIARRGRLVYARGFGYADREAKEPVRPDSLFRIASISKPITAVAILLLVDRGALALDARVLDILAIEASAVPGGKIAPRWAKVTIRHLLQHTSGWDAPRRDRDAVPIARTLRIAPPAPSSEVVRWMLGQPLDAEPGTRHVYSNLGYDMLGRVIEAVGGMPYDEFVRLRVLAPLGIVAMRVAPSAAEDHLPGEVHYYDSKRRSGNAEYGGAIGRSVPLPYALAMENLDAFGGWAASAVDLVRFASAFRREAPGPLLAPATFHAMLAPPDGPPGHRSDGRPRRSYYACGWVVLPEGNGGEPYFWHNGNLPGTSTLLVHRHHDEFDFAVLCNTDADPKGKRPADEIEHAINVAIDAVATWPDVDLFADLPSHLSPTSTAGPVDKTPRRGGEDRGN